MTGGLNGPPWDEATRDELLSLTAKQGMSGNDSPPESKPLPTASNTKAPLVSKTTAALIDLLQQRDALGLAKYGTTLDRTDLTLEDWLQHQLEEMLDGAGYAQAALRQLRAAPPVADLRGAIEGLLEAFESEVPGRNCSCHLHPPCSDCFEWSHKREAIAYARGQLAKGDAPFATTPPPAKDPRQPVSAQDSDDHAVVVVSVSGKVGIGKSSVLLVIQDALRAVGLSCVWDGEHSECNLGTGADDIKALEVKPLVVLHEVVVPAIPRVHDAQQKTPVPRFHSGGIGIVGPLPGEVQSPLPSGDVRSPPLVGERGPDPILKCLRCGAIGSIVCGGADCPGRSNPA